MRIKRASSDAITITSYVVAESKAHALALVSGTYSTYGRPFASTVGSRAAARLTVKDIARVPTNRPVRIFPVEITFAIGKERS